MRFQQEPLPPSAPRRALLLSASLAFAATLLTTPLVLAQPVSARSNRGINARSDYTQKLARQNATFVLVDFLEGFMPGVQTIEARLFRANATAFTRVSEIFAMPTILLGDEGGFRGKFFPEVLRHAGHAVRIERHTVSAWAEPKFRAQVEAFGRRKIVMAGISLDICVLQLALDMLGAGYEVYVAADASGSDTTLNELSAISRLTQAGVVMTNWGSVASEIMGDWNTPEGPKVGALYQEHSAWGRRF